MKKILLFLLLSTNVFAATAQVNNVFNIGGAVNGSYSALKPIDTSTFTLQAGVQGAVGGGFLKLTQMSGGAGSTGNQYQVTAGKTAVCYGFKFTTNTSGTQVSFGYGTAGVIANDTSTPPTGSVQYSSAANLPTFFSSSGITQADFFPIVIQFPASSFPYVWENTSTATLLIKMECAEY